MYKSKFLSIQAKEANRVLLAKYGDKKKRRVAGI
tara:strand:+ start:542 stop:643 length:102 start_codon:yes stop_codon:yes gene_type:complete